MCNHLGIAHAGRCGDAGMELHVPVLHRRISRRDHLLGKACDKRPHARADDGADPADDGEGKTGWARGKGRN